MDLRAIRGWLLDLIFPNQCPGCGQEGSPLCEACRGTLTARVPACPVCSRRNFSGILCRPCSPRLGLRRFLAPFAYSDPLARALIHAFKYEGMRDLAGPLAAEIASHIARHGIRPRPSALLVPIPLHKSRERERGFNQSFLLARELGERWGLAVVPALHRRRAAMPQVEMPSFAARRANVARAFRVADAAAVEGKSVILVDDVATSGATLAAASRVLRLAGARSVSAVAIAKG